MTIFFEFVNSLADVNTSAAFGKIFVTPNGDAYVYGGSNQLGGVWSAIGNFFENNAGSIIQTGVGIIGGLLNKPTNQAKGLAAITAFCNQVLGALDQLIQQAQQGRPRAEIYGAADQLVAVLSDSNAVYQARNGDDARVLRDAKTAAASKANQAKQIADAIEAAMIQQATGATPTGTPTGTQTGTMPIGTTANGQAIYQTSAGGIDQNTLLIGIAALGIILLLK